MQRCVLIALSFLLMAMPVSKTLADATPFKLTEKIYLSYQTSRKLTFDSCGIIYWESEIKRYDTFFHCHGHQHCVVSEDENYIKLTRGVPDSFRVLLFYKEKVLVSPLLKESGLNSCHKLLVTDTAVKDITPLFGVTYAKYLLALGITIFLELLVAFLFFLRDRAFSKLRYIVYVNLLTHPLLWLVCTKLTGFFTGSIYGEPVVIVLEALLLKGFAIKEKSFLKLLGLSAIMNLVSFFIGGSLYFILTSVFNMN